jgi:aldose 1-epimerase
LPTQFVLLLTAVNIHRETIGISSGHAEQGPTPVDAYTLDTGRGISIVVWTYGATLIEVLVPDRNAHLANVVVRLPDLRNYENRLKNPYFGATLGRFARCIAKGRFRLDEVDYQLECNFGGHHFHGGKIGFDRFVWNAEAERRGDELLLHLRLERPDGDQGYPGALSVETIYLVRGDGRLSFEHRAITTASTVVALTNHSYWNLASSGTVNNHRLALNAARVLLLDNELIPLGLPVDVVGTELDYTRTRPLADHRLDHCFVLDDAAWAAELFDPASGRFMRVLTDQPGLAVYSADGLTEPRVGLCLQTGAWPDSPNRADYPSSRLDPGAKYRHQTTHEFSTR